MMRFSQPLTALAVALACAASPRVSFAQSPAAPVAKDSAERVKDLFKRAEVAFGDGKFQPARTLLLEAWSLNQSYDVAAALGQAELELKMYRDAAEHFDFALKHRAPTSSAEAIEATKTDLRRAKADVAELQLTTTPTNAMISVDGKEAGPSPLSVFVEPGQHRIEARLGERVVSKAAIYAKGSTNEISLALPAQSAITPPPDSGLPPSAPTNDAKLNYVPPIVAASVGGALLIGGVVLVAVASSKRSQKTDLLDSLPASSSGKQCARGNPTPDKCNEIQDLSQSATTLTNVAIGSFIGAAAAGVATYLLWPDSPRSTGTARGITVLPSYSAFDHSFQLGAAGRF